jgi:NAD-dependent deacetylase
MGIFAPRGGLVWFGEALPEAAWQQAEDAALACAVIVVIGTSSLVWPAAKLPDMAAIRGAKIVQPRPDTLG